MSATAEAPAREPGVAVRRLAVVACGLTYLIALSWTYEAIVAPTFAYEGTEYRELDLWIRLASWVLAALPLFWIPTRHTRPSQVVYNSLYVLVLAPTVLFCHHVLPYRDPAQILAFQAVLVGAYFGMGMVYWARPPEFALPRVHPVWFWSTVGLAMFIGYAYLELTLGLRIDVVSFFDVYDLREQFEQSATRLVGYTYTWLANVLNPLLFAFALVRRKPLLLVGSIGLQLLMYSFAGSKSFLFGIMLIVVTLFAMAGRGRHFSSRYLGLVAAGVAALTVADLATDGFLFTAFATRRAIVVPAQLTSYYFDFFADNRLAMLGDSTLRGLVDYPYDLSVPYLIAQQYFGRPNMMANANFWADGFANFGWAGLIGASALLAAVMAVMDGLARGKDLKLTSLLAVIPAVSLCNSGLLTTLMTHGLGLTLVVLYLYPAERRASPPVALAPTAEPG